MSKPAEPRSLLEFGGTNSTSVFPAKTTLSSPLTTTRDSQCQISVTSPAPNAHLCEGENGLNGGVDNNHGHERGAPILYVGGSLAHAASWHRGRGSSQLRDEHCNENRRVLRNRVIGSHQRGPLRNHQIANRNERGLSGGGSAGLRRRSKTVRARRSVRIEVFA